MNRVSSLLVFCPLLVGLFFGVDARAAPAAEPRVMDRAVCEEECVASCAAAPMKKFLCERRCRASCKKEHPSPIDTPKKK